ncbi:FTR1 family protein [Candidatus Micrarchaeota archaeon]|nr:FTR1 family protein [Candidatus Micrarchaeota archaeon]
MLPSFLITFRETFEAALIIGIILAYLSKTGNKKFEKFVFMGVGAGIAISALSAYVFSMLFGEFEGTAEQLFEGTTMFIAAALVTTMVFWMARQRNISEQIKNKVQESLDKKYGIGLLLFAFFAVYREGIEIILFLNATAIGEDGGISLFGAFLGIASSIVLAFMFFKAAMKIDLRKFFLVTGTVLIIISAGLIAHGIHEYQEAGVLNFLKDQAWSTKSLLDDQTDAGKIIRSVVGYNDDPSALEVAGYFGYLAIVAYFWKKYSIGKQ